MCNFNEHRKLRSYRNIDILHSRKTKLAKDIIESKDQLRGGKNNYKSNNKQLIYHAPYDRQIDVTNKQRKEKNIELQV